MSMSVQTRLQGGREGWAMNERMEKLGEGFSINQWPVG